MNKKTLTLLSLFCFTAFGLYQGYLSRLEIEDFEKRFQETTFSAKSIEAPIIEKQKAEEIVNVATAPQITEAVQEAPVKAYQPTDKDPLHHLSNSVKEAPAFQELSDFSRDELDVVLKTKQRAALAQTSAQVIVELQKCLTNSSCVEDVDKNSEYYKEGHTRSHQLLERSLHTLIIIQEEDEKLRNTMAFEDKLAILEVDNSEIQRLGIELLGTQELSSDQVQKTLERHHKIDQEAQGALFTQLERYTRLQPKLREMYLEQMKSQFTQDAQAAIEILKVLPFTKLEENEIAQVSRGLCPHQKNIESQEWKTIEYHHSLYQDSQGLSTRLSSLCSAQ